MVQRRSHRLRANRQDERPSRLLFWDVESYLVKVSETLTEHHLRLGWACYWRRARSRQIETVSWREFCSVAEFWDWVLGHVHSREKLWCVAHNMVYDMVLVDGFRELHRRGWECQHLYTDRGTNIWRWRQGNRTLQFVDNLNYFRSSLEELGEEIGIPKLTVDFATVADEELSVYCRRDVEVLLAAWRWLLGVVEEHDLGNFGVTIPSQAFNAFRHRFLGHSVYIHSRCEISVLERAAYTGARVECYRLGRMPPGEYLRLDVNAMYPHVMERYDYPTRLVGVVNDVQLGELEVLLRDYLCVAQVQMLTETPYYPYRMGWQLVFPVGEFTAYLATPELRLALLRGEVASVDVVAYYDRARLFAAYVQELYALRQDLKGQGRPAQAYVVKLLLNSLYGKFGQAGRRWVPIGEGNSEEFKVWKYCTPRTEWVTQRNIYGRLEQLEEGGESWNSFPAIAAHVTAYARVHMLDLILRAGQEHVYYTDTDSLIVDAEGLARLGPEVLDERRLGALKVEEITRELTIYSPKDYATEGATVRKGISPRARQLSEDTFLQEHFPSLAGIMLTGNVSTYRTWEQAKVLHRNYLKGTVDQDGLVHPLRMPRDQEQLLWSPLPHPVRR